jgi:hypothetical protein
VGGGEAQVKVVPAVQRSRSRRELEATSEMR